MHAKRYKKHLLFSSCWSLFFRSFSSKYVVQPKLPAVNVSIMVHLGFAGYATFSVEAMVR